MERISGYIDHIIFQNSENGYTVLELAVAEKMITCVGTLLGVSDGMHVELEGDYTEHPSYGRQFKATRFVEKEPEDELAIERYLGSGAIKGVGAALAARIVRRFGRDTFRIIEEEPERLAEIKGISERKAQEISVQVEEKRALRSAMLFLQQYGISLTLAVKIYQTYNQWNEYTYRIVGHSFESNTPQPDATNNLEVTSVDKLKEDITPNEGLDIIGFLQRLWRKF